jgi:hypothetical protein
MKLMNIIIIIYWEGVKDEEWNMKPSLGMEFGIAGGE